MEIRWAVDNALNFVPHAAVFVLAVAAYAVFGRHWSIAVISLVVVAVAGGYVARSDALLARAHDCSSVDRLRVATFNVQAGRADLDALASYLEAERVDVVVLEEMTFAASFRADALYDRYPYGAASTPRWVEILSLVPLEATESFPVYGQNQAREVWRSTVTAPFPVDLYFMHGQTARSGLLQSVRTSQFERVEQLLAAQPGPALVLGDMNATVLDPSFSSMLRDTGLRTAISGHRDSPTWPSNLGPFGIRIDHVLERGFEVCSVQRGPSLGSDHRPVIVEIAQSQTG